VSDAGEEERKRNLACPPATPDLLDTLVPCHSALSAFVPVLLLTSRAAQHGISGLADSPAQGLTDRSFLSLCGLRCRNVRGTDISVVLYERFT
jgi:hypothetical protein